jgi:hypothetical protein
MQQVNETQGKSKKKHECTLLGTQSHTHSQLGYYGHLAAAAERVCWFVSQQLLHLEWSKVGECTKHSGQDEQNASDLHR